MRFHRPKRRQSASTSTWPPCAGAWSELVRRRCRVDFCFVNNGMDTHHHKGDVAASTISPAIAFLFTRLRIGGAAAMPACSAPRQLGELWPLKMPAVRAALMNKRAFTGALPLLFSTILMKHVPQSSRREFLRRSRSERLGVEIGC